MALDWTFGQIVRALAENDSTVVDACTEFAKLRAAAIVGDSETARDLAQDAIVRLVSKAATMDPDRPVGPWLSVVTRNLAFDYARRRPPSLEDTPLGEFEDGVVDYQDLLAALRASRRELDELTFMIGYRRIALGESVEEVIVALGLPPNSGKKRVPKAVIKFLTVLARNLRGFGNGREERHG